MHRNWHLLLLEDSQIRKTNMFENADLQRTNWQKRYFDANIPDIRSSGELENILTTDYK